MKIIIIMSHITCDGAIAPGTVLDVHDELAIEYLNAKLAEPHKEATAEKATSKKTKETATAK